VLRIDTALTPRVVEKRELELVAGENQTERRKQKMLRKQKETEASRKSE